MKKIELIALYGEETKTVEICQPNGAGGVYQILIDRYYQGTIMQINGEWVGHLNSKSELTGDDITILAEIIEEKMPRNS